MCFSFHPQSDRHAALPRHTGSPGYSSHLKKYGSGGFLYRKNTHAPPLYQPLLSNFLECQKYTSCFLLLSPGKSIGFSGYNSSSRSFPLSSFPDGSHTSHNDTWFLPVQCSPQSAGSSRHSGNGYSGFARIPHWSNWEAS